MRILIIVGFVIPKAAASIGEKESPFGGWVSGLIEGLSEIEGLEVGVAMKSSQKSLLSTNIENVKYYYLPSNKSNQLDVNLKDCFNVISDFKPDIIHAEGAEVFITNRFLKIFQGIKVISVKGVFNDIQKYEYGGILPASLIFSFNFYNIIFGLTQIYKQKYRFKKRREIEIDSYKEAQYVIGRTLYDKAHILSFNKKIKYFHNNETLRLEFYRKRWLFEKVERYSIFVGNGLLARKGAHIVIKAVALLKQEFPLIKLYIVGNRGTSIKEKLTYKGYIDTLITNAKLNEQVYFMGQLDESSMSEALLSKHVYVLPSFVENSSNTLGEAMLMGVPSIASYCGGVSSLATDEKEVLFYRPNDFIMLAHQIKRIFDGEVDANELSDNARNKALNLYNKKNNADTVINIYKQILKNEI